MSNPSAPAISGKKRGWHLTIPTDKATAEIDVDGGRITLSNLQKIFWPEDAITKRDLLQYYADISPFLLPHLLNRAMVMKRYHDGAYGKFFFQKRAPDPRPKWIPICAIQHPSANVVDFPVIQNLAGLLWVVNLGCIDLNPWYARCDDVDRPDYLHFDLRSDTRRGLRAGARGCTGRARRACGTEDPELSQDHGVTRSARLRANRARTIAKGSLDLRQGSGKRTRGAAS